MIITYAVIALTAVAVRAASVSDESVNEFKLFKAQYGKTYKNEKEEAFRMEVYLNDSRYIREHNKLYDEGKVSYRMGVNKFSDLLYEEFKEMMLMNENEVSAGNDFGLNPFCELMNFTNSSDTNKIDSWDWRLKNAVSPVKDQGSLGVCWAFSAVAALESHYLLNTSKLVDLSEQNLVDCICRTGIGGWADKAFEYVFDREGIDSEESYPYIQKQNKVCNYEKSKSVLKIRGCKTLRENDEEQLKIALTKVGPISVSYFVPKNLHKYTGGVFYDRECLNVTHIHVNHQVLLVGFGTEKGEDYWLVKNSWGADSGEKGYFRTRRNANNHCLIAARSAYPIF